jgi:biopolymer transport protein ExbB
VSRTASLAALVLATVLAVASGAVAATSLDELLEQTKNARAKEAQQSAEREAEFRASRDQQAKLLADALARRAAAEGRSQQLSAQYDANEKVVHAENELLRTREGSLGELFGVTRQVAGDAANVLSQSLISAEHPEREDFLRGLAGAKALPSIAELERLWFELQREMTETGRVARLQAQVVDLDGSTRSAEVVRIGPFIASSGGEYLSYLPGLKRLARLSRQPPRRFTRLAEDLADAQNGYTRAVADPSRGVLLALYVERPNALERVEKGELVGYVIIAVGIVGALLAAYQFVFLVLQRMAVRRQLAQLDRPTPDNPLGRVLLAFRGDPARIEEEAGVAELRLSEAVLHEVPRLERFQSFLRLAVAAGPLLGLIGTVIGMIITFQSITESGSSDPKLMATGIGQAMIATVLGLGIAIPLLFVNAGLASMSRGLVQILDEQSLGLLAESIEKRRVG